MYSACGLFRHIAIGLKSSYVYILYNLIIVVEEALCISMLMGNSLKKCLFFICRVVKQKLNKSYPQAFKGK